MTNDEQFAALLGALRALCDATPDTADPSDLRWRTALRGLLLAFDPNPQSPARPSSPASPYMIRELYPRRDLLHIDDPALG